MINVIASIRVKAGKRSDFIKIFKANMPAVQAEKGCIEYFPAVDIMPPCLGRFWMKTSLRSSRSGESGSVARSSESASHAGVREKVKDIVESSSLKILQGA